MFPLLICGLTLTATIQAYEARLAVIDGTVEMRSSADAEWVSATSGSALPEGGEVRTASQSTAQLTFTSGQKSAIDIRPDSYVRIESVEPARVHIHSGKIFSLIKYVQPGSSFVIVTPTAIASARGTGGEHGIEDLIVRDGTFTVETPSGQIREVAEGFGVEFKDDGFGESFEAPESAEWSGFAEAAAASLDAEQRVVDRDVKSEGGEGGGPGGPGGPGRPGGPLDPSGDKGGEGADFAPGMREPLPQKELEQVRSMDTETIGVDADVMVHESEAMAEPMPEAPKNAAGVFEEFEDIVEDLDRDGPAELGDKRSIPVRTPIDGILDRAGQTRETYHDVKADDKLADSLRDPLPKPGTDP